MGRIATNGKARSISLAESAAEESAGFQDREESRLSPWQLLGICDPRHPLCLLADAVDWEEVLRDASAKLPRRSHWPSRNLRLILGLASLSRRFGVDAAECISRFQENIYWQYYCGLREIQWKCEVEAAVLERWLALLEHCGWDGLQNPPERQKSTRGGFGSN